MDVKRKTPDSREETGTKLERNYNVNQAAQQTAPSKSAVVQPKQPNPIVKLRHDLEAMAPEFMAVLPPQITIENFKRVVLTALQTTTGLAECSPKSIWNACMRAATDGLLPDGREGAIVPYKNVATWLPMVGGLKKKIFQSGKVATLMCEVVRKNDVFDHQEGDDPFIHHKKSLGKDDPGEIVAIYSIAVMKDGGEISREVMSIWEVEQVRKSSRGTNTPWNVPEFYPEMAKKTCVKRHAKSLPQSKELVEFLHHDDVNDGIIEPEAKPARPRPSDFTDVDESQTETKPDTKTTETNSGEDSAVKGKAEGEAADQSAAANSSAKPSEKVNAETGEVTEYGPADAMLRGREDHAAGKTRKAVPPEFREPSKESLSDAWYAGWDDANEITANPDQKKLV